MPYCPKCDMEFVEGVTVCTDCGGPLVSSKEEYERQKREEEETAEKELQKHIYDAAENAGAIPAVAPGRRAPDVYVSKAERYEDYSSSATAFIIVGILALVAAVLGFMGVLPLPFYGSFKTVMLVLIALLGIASFAVALNSFSKARNMKGAVTEEKVKTDELTESFLEDYSASAIDDMVNSENPADLAPEERTLKRLLIIQDIIITGNDITDQAYVDELAEEIYDRLFDD